MPRTVPSTYQVRNTYLLTERSLRAIRLDEREKVQREEMVKAHVLRNCRGGGKLTLEKLNYVERSNKRRT